MFVSDARSFTKALQEVRGKNSADNKQTPDVYVELPNAPHGFNILPGLRGEALNVSVEAFLKDVLQRNGANGVPAARSRL